MIATTHAGADAWLVPYQPNWERGVRLTVGVATAAERSLTGRESRQALGASLRCRLSWAAVLSLAELAELRNGQAAAQDERILVPAWPFAVAGSEWSGAEVGGGVTIGWMDGWGTWDIDPSTPADWDWVAPVLVGRIDVGLPTLILAEYGEVTFGFAEDGSAEWGLSPGARAYTAGPALDDASTPYVFPLGIDWDESPRGGTLEVEVSRIEIGRAPRARLSVFYPQTPTARAEGSVTLTTPAEVGTLLRWWLDRQADVQPHFVTTAAALAELSAPASAGASEIVLVDGSMLGDVEWLALGGAFGVEVVRVDDVTGDTVALVGTLGAAVSPRSTVVSAAALARSADAEMEIRFELPGVGRARLAWVEVAEEYVVADGAGNPPESRGETIGAQTVEAWLYRFTVQAPGVSDVVYRRTSYERDLTASSATWTAAPIKHGALRRSVQLDRDEVTIETEHGGWTGEFLPGELRGRVLVDIYRCDVSGSTGSSVAQVWSGEVGSVSFRGPVVQARAVGPYAIFDRPVPRFVVQPGCNHAVYDAGCGLSAASWTFTATVNADSATHQVALKSWAKSGGLPSGWGRADYFALGYLVTPVGGRWWVLRSTEVSGGLVTVTLDRAGVWTTDADVSLVVGCDGNPTTCRAYHSSTNPRGVFNNFLKFGGFPFVPAKNPTFDVPKRTESAYGKK